MKRILFTILAVSGVLNASDKALATGESYPGYYADLERIVLKDVMTRYFNVSDTGILSFGFEDAVKAAGHACPAITGSYLISREGLKALANSYKENPNTADVTSFDYDSGLLYRGGVKVTMSGADNTGSANNAIGNVLALISGARGGTGFAHGPDFPFANRQHLFAYEPELQFSTSKGIEAIFTSMKATYTKTDENGNSVPATLAECQGTWGDCVEQTSCDRSVKVTYKFQSPDIIGTDPNATWDVKIKNILDNADKAITTEMVDNPAQLCTENKVSGISGTWFDRNHAGSGFTVIESEQGSFAYYYGYKDNSETGHAQWLLSDFLPKIIVAGEEYTVDVVTGFIGNGGTFATKPTEGTHGTKSWGQMTVAFDNCSSGTVTFNGDDGTVTQDIIKLANVNGVACVASSH